MLRILTYHRIGDPAATPDLDPALVSATPEDFRVQMRHLADRYRVVDLARVLNAFQGGGSLPDRAVLITFDDAYRDFGEIAWPILREHGLAATVFVPTAFPGRPERSFWWDRLHRAGLDGSEERDLKARLKTLPPDEALDLVDRVSATGPSRTPPRDRSPVLDWEELAALKREGVDLGTHTRTHPALVHATEARVREELRGSMAELTARVGPVPPTICYPYGLHDERVVRIARSEGFALGFTNVDGLNRPGDTDPLRLRRTNVTRRTSPLLFRLRMRPWFARVDRWRHRKERRNPLRSEHPHQRRQDPSRRTHRNGTERPGRRRTGSAG